MIDKSSLSMQEAIAKVHDGATVLIGGFGTAGQPAELIDALIAHGAKDLTIVNNNAGNGDIGLAALLKAGQVKKIICSFPRQSDSYIFDELYRAGKIELELVPQGNLACRIQAAGMGLGPIYTPTGFGTLLAEGKPTLNYEGKDFVLTTNPNGSIGESYREEIKTLKDNGYVIPTNPASDGLYHVTKGRK